MVGSGDMANPGGDGRCVLRRDGVRPERRKRGPRRLERGGGGRGAQVFGRAGIHGPGKNGRGMVGCRVGGDGIGGNAGPSQRRERRGPVPDELDDPMDGIRQGPVRGRGGSKRAGGGCGFPWADGGALGGGFKPGDGRGEVGFGGGTREIARGWRTGCASVGRRRRIRVRLACAHVSGRPHGDGHDGGIEGNGGRVARDAGSDSDGAGLGGHGTVRPKGVCGFDGSGVSGLERGDAPGEVADGDGTQRARGAVLVRFRRADREGGAGGRRGGRGAGAGDGAGRATGDGEQLAGVLRVGPPGNVLLPRVCGGRGEKGAVHVAAVARRHGLGDVHDEGRVGRDRGRNKEPGRNGGDVAGGGIRLAKAFRE